MIVLYLGYYAARVLNIGLLHFPLLLDPCIVAFCTQHARSLKHAQRHLGWANEQPADSSHVEIKNQTTL